MRLSHIPGLLGRSGPAARRLVAGSLHVPQTRLRLLGNSMSSNMSSSSSRSSAALNAGLRDLLQVSREVSEAIAADRPVVALESTIYTHGALGKDLAREHEELVRSCGGVPAIIAVVDGVPKVGVSNEDIVRMMEDEGTTKASRRDIAYLVGMGLAGRKIHGGTTIAGTMLLARLAGIRVFGTGGLGGVHRGGEASMDISADLTELGRTRVAVVSSGCKGFLDIPRTLEYLETQGCLVATFADGRGSGQKGDKEAVDFPAFWARESGVASPAVVRSEREAAAVILAQERLGIESGMLFANPIPEEAAIPAPEMRAAIEQAVGEADARGFTGARNTPYVLGRLRELTGGRAVAANKALVRANIARATGIAVELSRLLKGDAGAGAAPAGSSFFDVKSSWSARGEKAAQQGDARADILVAGSVALDLSCDYAGSKKGDLEPRAHTSNPASITQSIGGVGHNVALAAHLASREARVKLYSMVGDDVAGDTILSALRAEGLDTMLVQKLDRAKHPASRTAQYVAINDRSKNLVMAMADMGIFSQHTLPEDWRAALRRTDPAWLVVDGNWSAGGIRAWIKAGKEHGCRVAFEPVSVDKSAQLFSPSLSSSSSSGGGGDVRPGLGIYPRASVDVSSPNQYELAAMHAAARENGYLDSAEWFGVIDAFGMRGARERFVRLTSAELTDAGVPVQSVQLLPYIPTVVAKLGARGVLLTQIMGRDDPRLRDAEEDRYVLTRSFDGDSAVGGVYMRLYPTVEEVDSESVVSVNGVGDTFLGVVVSGLAQGGRVEKLVDVAQRGAVYSLKHAGSVSPQVSLLEEDLRKVALLK